MSFRCRVVRLPGETATFTSIMTAPAFAVGLPGVLQSGCPAFLTQPRVQVRFRRFEPSFASFAGKPLKGKDVGRTARKRWSSRGNSDGGSLAPKAGFLAAILGTPGAYAIGARRARARARPGTGQNCPAIALRVEPQCLVRSSASGKLIEKVTSVCLPLK